MCDGKSFWENAIQLPGGRSAAGNDADAQNCGVTGGETGWNTLHIRGSSKTHNLGTRVYFDNLGFAVPMGGVDLI